MPSVTVADLQKIYSPTGVIEHVVFDHFSLHIPAGKIVALVGPNGSGKTTLLNCIANLTTYEAGSIQIDHPGARPISIGFVFQNYRESLFPWLTNIDNIVCMLDQPSSSRTEKRSFVRSWAANFNISLPWETYPYQCSGGQQQLIVLLRELINQPDVLLMDEPFVALDYEKRLAWRQQLMAVLDAHPTTVILVSHDIEEAIYLADEVIVLGNQPTKIMGRFVIDLPRPRFPRLLQDKKFFQWHSSVLNTFMHTSGIV